ncbi:major facilitator superfamily domain-containing protein [Mycena epipterygia]|nr:major facilitator superfamily domain-containing protein [Mycena epipterygia]
MSSSMQDSAHNSKIDDKAASEHMETTDEEYIKISEEDNRRILRKTDIRLLSISCADFGLGALLRIRVYWLQILDKSVLGYAATFGLKTAAHLHGNKYSTLGSMNAIAQLAWMPFSSYLLIHVPPCILMSVLPACHFLLGLFEAACLPLFAILTSVWYRRAEEPLRICMWYGTNGLGTIIASAFAYGFGNIKSPKISRLPDDLPVLRSDDRLHRADRDRKKAVERVRANDTGTKPTDKYKWGKALEAVLEPKTWLFFAMALCVNFGASITLTFGPLTLNGIGFDQSRTSLLNMPFGGFQITVIFSAPYAAYRFKTKSLVTAVLVLPVLAGLIILYKLHGGLLVGYSLLAFLYGANPLIVSWISANTAGSTKKSVVLVGYNAASSVGNIVGPFLFRDTDAPPYRRGLLSCIGIFVALAGSILLQVVNFMILNHLKQRQRIARGKPAVLHDASMDNRFRQRTQSQLDREKLEAASTGVALGDNSLLDLTDWQNDEFVYVYEAH